MREYLFRGKSLYTGKWVYGYFAKLRDYLYEDDRNKDHYVIILLDSDLYPHNEVCYPIEVNPETIGQWTGLVDKNGVKIFEGDVLDTPIWIVTYLANANSGYGMNAGWYIQRDNFESWEELECANDHEVLGNIHDNPELVERK